MKKHKLLSFLLSFLLTALAVFTGCSSTPTSGTIDADQTINMIGYDYSSLDPSSVTDAESFTTFQNVYEGLLREVNKNGVDTVELAGASKMDVSTDGLTYTFTIRDSKWSDGKPVTAKDYEFAWKRLIDPSNAFDYMHYLDCIKGVKEYIAGTGKIEEVAIKAISEKQFQVTLDKPIVFFEKMLIFKGLVPQREDKVKELGKNYGVDYKKMVYNGPFVVSEFQKGSKIVYTKNEQYWDAKNVKLQRANCYIVAEPTTLLQMFQAKQMDQIGATTPDLLAQLEKMEAGGGIEHATGTLPSVFYYGFNCKSPILSNSKVRMALSLAFDRQQQIDVLWKRYIPAYGLVTPSMFVGDKEFRSVVEEPLKSVIDEKKDPKGLLMEGLKEMNLDDPSKVNLLLLMGQTTTARKTQAEFIQKQWQDKLGVKIQIKYAVDGPSYFEERSKGSFDIFSGGWGSDYNDVFSMLEFMRTGNGNNNCKYENKDFDELVNKGEVEKDPAKRLELFKQAEEIAVKKDAAIAPYFYQDLQTFRYNYVKGMFMPLFGGYYDLREVYISGKK